MVLLYKVISEYAKSILACTENTLKAFKLLGRIRQEYFAVYGEYAERHKIEPISANCRPKPKKTQILNPHSIYTIEWAKKISPYCPFKEEEERKKDREVKRYRRVDRTQLFIIYSSRILCLSSCLSSCRPVIFLSYSCRPVIVAER